MTIIAGSISGPVYGTAAESAIGAIVENMNESSPSDVEHLEDGQSNPVHTVFPTGVGEFSAELTITNHTTCVAALLRGHTFTPSDSTHFGRTYYINQVSKARKKRGYMTYNISGFYIPDEATAYTTTTAA